MKYRSFLATVLAVWVAVSASAATAPFGIGTHGLLGASGGTGPGFLPAGHFIDANQPMIDVFPRPDSETSATAREHQAYIGEEYDIAIGASFGAYPYICTLVNGPPGMTVEQSTYTTFQNPQYCRVSWTPTTNYNGEAEVQVEDQQHNILDVSWAVWTVGAYTTSAFSGTATVNGTNTLTVNTVGSGAITPGMVITGTDIPSGDYIAFDLTGTGGTGTYQLASAATGSAGPESITGAYEGGAIFVSASGSGTTCTSSAPCTLTTAFGSTFGTSSFPGAIVYANGGTYTGAFNLPLYTDNDIFGSADALFEPNTSTKPVALIGIPGQTVTLDVTGQTSNYYIAVGGEGADWYMENIQGNGYNPSVIARFLEMLSGGAGTARQTYDQIVWNNSGYGTGASNNESMFISSGNSSPRPYLFITDSEETNRESGDVGNNYGFCDLYSETDALVQRSTEDSPSSNLDAAFYFKSDIHDGDMRENFANVLSAVHGFDYGQNQFVTSGFNQTDYNIGLNVGAIYTPQTPNYTFSSIWVLRNSIISTHGLDSTQPNYNLEGPQQATPTASGSGTTLAAGEYWIEITSLGVTGESRAIAGSHGNGGTPAGSSNEQNITITAGQQINISWTAEPGATGYNVYISAVNGGTGSENIQFSPGNVTSFTYTGQTGTTATPPSTSTALSTYRFDFSANAVQTSQSPQPIAGAAISSVIPNVTAASGLLNSSTGLLTGTYANPPSGGGVLGIDGAQISGTP